MKDNDLTYKLRLGSSASRKLRDVLHSDVCDHRACCVCYAVSVLTLRRVVIPVQSEFLCRHGVMDYSLLLGVHRNKYNLVDKRTLDVRVD
jgi:hypothetical protein